MPYSQLPSLSLLRSPANFSEAAPSQGADSTRREVLFVSLFRPGHALGFPCDESGSVDVESLPPAARRNYLIALARVGSEYALPEVRVVGPARH